MPCAWFYGVLGIELKVSCLPGQHPINRSTSPALQLNCEQVKLLSACRLNWEPAERPLLPTLRFPSAGGHLNTQKQSVTSLPPRTPVTPERSGEVVSPPPRFLFFFLGFNFSAVTSSSSFFHLFPYDFPFLCWVIQTQKLQAKRGSSWGLSLGETDLENCRCSEKGGRSGNVCETGARWLTQKSAPTGWKCGQSKSPRAS